MPHLIKGSLDAITAFPALSYKVQLAGQGRILVDLGKEMPENLPDVWVATQEIIDKNPELVRKSLQALFAALKHLKDNPEYAINYIKEFNNYDLNVAELEYKNTIMGMLDDGIIKKEWLQNSLDLAKLAGTKEQLPPVENIFTDQFVPIKLDK